MRPWWPACCRISACAKGIRATTPARATRKFVLAPGSVLTKRPPRWIVVADLVETSRLYGRIAARIEPEVVERVAGHLVQRTYSEPHWDAKRGAVMAYERVTLYGLAARAAPAGRLRRRRPGGGPRTVHPPRAGRGRLADPPPLLPRQRARCGRSWPNSRSAPAAATCWSATTRSTRSTTTAIPAAGGLGAPLRRLVEEAAPPDAGPADLHPRRSAAGRRRRLRIDRTTGRPGTCRCR